MTRVNKLKIAPITRTLNSNGSIAIGRNKSKCEPFKKVTKKCNPASTQQQQIAANSNDNKNNKKSNQRNNNKGTKRINFILKSLQSCISWKKHQCLINILQIRKQLHNHYHYFLARSIFHNTISFHSRASFSPCPNFFTFSNRAQHSYTIFI